MIEGRAFPRPPLVAGGDEGGLASMPASIGVLAGIARHDRRRAPMEVIQSAMVSCEHGLHGDMRGKIRPGGTGKRQVTLMASGDWQAALAEIGVAIPWQERRVNLLVEGLDLPHVAGVLLRIGADVLLSVTVECDPCRRMDELAPGLQAAMRRDWRGGICTRVTTGGNIAVSDGIRIEQA